MIQGKYHTDKWMKMKVNFNIYREKQNKTVNGSVGCHINCN